MTLNEKFEIYHASNPQIFALFKAYATLAKDAGFDRYSANSIFEKIRWHLNVETVGDVYKMNNNYRAYYSRMLMKERGFEGFFEIRNKTKISVVADDGATVPTPVGEVCKPQGMVFITVYGKEPKDDD